MGFFMPLVTAVLSPVALPKRRKTYPPKGMHLQQTHTGQASSSEEAWVGICHGRTTKIADGGGGGGRHNPCPAGPPLGSIARTVSLAVFNNKSQLTGRCSRPRRGLRSRAGVSLSTCSPTQFCSHPCYTTVEYAHIRFPYITIVPTRRRPSHRMPSAAPSHSVLQGPLSVSYALLAACPLGRLVRKNCSCGTRACSTDLVLPSSRWCCSPVCCQAVFLEVVGEDFLHILGPGWEVLQLNGKLNIISGEVTVPHTEWLTAATHHLVGAANSRHLHAHTHWLRFSLGLGPVPDPRASGP